MYVADQTFNLAQTLEKKLGLCKRNVDNLIILFDLVRRGHP